MPWGSGIEALDRGNSSTSSTRCDQLNLRTMVRWFNSTGKMLSKLSTQLNIDAKLIELN
jgi:hypothetical protein